MRKNKGKLSDRARAALEVLCSNYRESYTVEAEFRCRVAYGVKRFVKEVRGYLAELKRCGYVEDYSLTEPVPRGETASFTVTAAMSMGVDEMAEACINSRTVYRQD